LVVNASGLVNLQNGSQINSSSMGSGDGGTVEVNAGSLKLNQNAQINASTTSSDGGNLVLNVSQVLQMSDRSILNAGAGGTGNGGNISLSTLFLLGSGNSDIIATAVLGHGGNINITTDGIYGLAFRNQLTPENDITASSQFGVDGTVEITIPGVAPNSGLVKLPENLTDHSQQITTGCANQSSSSFVASGRGGIAPNPTYELISDRTWSDVRDTSAYLKPSNTTRIIAASPEALVSATGWHRNAEGKVELISAASTVQVRDKLTCAAVPKN
jgi:large exoprotein involved in heme utilization and adhesion